MNVETITMPKADAAVMLETWRKKLSKLGPNVDPVERREYESALAGYKVLAKGTPLIHLRNSIVAAGVDHEGLPILAVVRADAKTVSLSMSTQGEAEFRHPKHYGPGRTPLVPRSYSFRFPGVTRSNWASRRAIVPMVPLTVRPDSYNPKAHLILWEAHWTPEPPVDPMLLKPIGGELHAVVAAWDLTAIERAVIAGRLR